MQEGRRGGDTAAGNNNKDYIYIYIYMREKEKTTSPADDAIRTKKGGGKEKVIKK